jgi:hypothetical protein
MHIMCTYACTWTRWRDMAVPVTIFITHGTLHYRLAFVQACVVAKHAYSQVLALVQCRFVILICVWVRWKENYQGLEWFHRAGETCIYSNWPPYTQQRHVMHQRDCMCKAGKTWKIHEDGGGECQPSGEAFWYIQVFVIIFCFETWGFVRPKVSTLNSTISSQFKSLL